MTSRHALPRALRQFTELFNAGDYWESHEVLEGPWREGRSPAYHGLILFASAFVHVDRGNRHGVQAQLGKAERRLRGLPSAYLGLDLDYIRAEARAWTRLAAGAGDDWRVRRPRPRLTLDPTRIGGDEPELAAPD